MCDTATKNSIIIMQFNVQHKHSYSQEPGFTN